MGKLLSLKVEGLRSLRHTTLTLVDSGCTALVGPNDSGKSSILYALHFLFVPNARLAPDDLCRPFKGAPYVEAIVEIKKATTIGSHSVSAGKYTVTRKFNDDKYNIRALPGAEKAVHLPNVPQEHLSTFLPAFFRASSEIFPYELRRSESGGPMARQIISKMFHFISPLDAMTQLEAEDEAKREIAGLLKAFWKSAARENFSYTSRDQNVTYSVSAQERRYFPLSHMGAGFQRAFSLALQIYDFKKIAKPRDILVAMDEPEVSLHPQAQRDFLHFIQQYPDAQFVYATHSPAMIDIGRPESIRTVFFSEEKQSTDLTGDSRAKWNEREST